ncbi:MAG: DUF1653 domain-containing protein [Patescibacteria group bacterium]
MIIPGIYIHYKGGRCEVIGVARHSETLEEHVVYRHVDGDTGLIGLWVRPAAMFAENVVVNGESVPRFRFIESL